MLDDIQRMCQEEMEWYEPEEIQQIQSRAKERATECASKMVELLDEYLVDNSEDAENERSVIYTVAFIDCFAELFYNSASTKHTQNIYERYIKDLFE